MISFFRSIGYHPLISLAGKLAPLGLAIGALLLWKWGPTWGGDRLWLCVAIGIIPAALWRLMGKPVTPAYRIGILAALAVFLFSSGKFRPTADDLSRLARHWPLVAWGLLAAMLQPPLGAIRWRILLNSGGIKVTLWESLRLVYAGQFFNIFLPGATGGDALRAYVVAKDRKATGAAVASVMLDRFLGLPPLIILAAMVAWLDQDFLKTSSKLSLITPVLMIAAVLCLGIVVVLASIKPVPESQKAGWRKRLSRIRNLFASHAGGPWIVTVAIFYGLLAHIASVGACVLFSRAAETTGVPPSRELLMIIIAFVVNSIPGSPGGIGQGELALGALLEMAAPNSGNAQAGVLIMLLLRFGNALNGLVGGLVYLTGRHRIPDGGETETHAN